MSNVLPQENQKKVLRAQRTRFLLVFAEVALLCALVFYIALLPGFFALIVGGVKAQNETVAASTTSQATTLRETKTRVTQLSAITGATSTPSEILRIILAAKPEGVSIDTMSFTAGNPGKIVVGGGALRTDLIQAYRKTLDADAHFDSVNIPVSALVGSDNDTFTMTLSGSF